MWLDSNAKFNAYRGRLSQQPSPRWWQTKQTIWNRETLPPIICLQPVAYVCLSVCRERNINTRFKRLISPNISKFVPVLVSTQGMWIYTSRRSTIMFRCGFNRLDILDKLTTCTKRKLCPWICPVVWICNIWRVFQRHYLYYNSP